MTTENRLLHLEYIRAKGADIEAQLGRLFRHADEGDTKERVARQLLDVTEKLDEVEDEIRTLRNSQRLEGVRAGQIKRYLATVPNRNVKFEGIDITI